MDNITLNEEQLWQLRQFIIKRGIKEADVIHEVLDHFACKVEEIISLHPNTPFERAMNLAHQSFGSSGFRPLVAEYEKHLEQIMWKSYKTSLKETILSPEVFVSLFSALLFYLFITRVPELWNSHWFFNVEFWAIAFSSLAFIATKIYFNRKLKRQFGVNVFNVKKLEYWQKISLTLPGNAMLAANCALIITPSTQKAPSIYLLIYCCLIILLSTISSLAQYKTFLQMEKRFGQKMTTV